MYQSNLNGSNLANYQMLNGINIAQPSGSQDKKKQAKNGF